MNKIMKLDSYFQVPSNVYEYFIHKFLICIFHILSFYQQRYNFVSPPNPRKLENEMKCCMRYNLLRVIN